VTTLGTRITAIALVALVAGAASRVSLRAEPTPAPRHSLSATRGVRLARTAPRTVWDSVFTEEQAKRGEELYGQSCARCHQDTLIGKDDALPLAGSAFFAGWDKHTLNTLFDRINSSMPSDDPGSLSKQQIADVIAYILRFNGFPAGKAELPVQADLLREITLLATKP
jgi:mono/diheme cytochrome c family protein